jgi:hypothetical protein
MSTMHLTHKELALFAELLDEMAHDREHQLLRDRIETYLYVAGYYDEQVPRGHSLAYIEGNEWRTGVWHAWDGLIDAYGDTAAEAIAELHRNQGKRA